MAPTAPDLRAERMALLLQLERRARAEPDLLGLGFLMVNDSRSLIDYQQALLWDSDRQRISACSGLARLEDDAPYMLQLRRWCQHWQQQPWAGQIHAVASSDVAADDQAQWQQDLGPCLIWVPLRGRQGQWLGSLLLQRQQPLPAPEQALLGLLQDAYGHAWQALLGPARPGLRRWKRRPARLVVGAALAVLVLALLPVRQSVLAPAEIIAHDPAVLRAPLQAVVERMLVQPNQAVQAGQPLVQLDRRELDNRLESARQALAGAEAQLRQARQQALFDERAKADLAELTSRRDQAQGDVDYLQDNLQRSLILAPRAGIAVFDDPSEWIGRPVNLGERIMEVANPDDVRLEVLLPVADAIELHEGDDLRLFLNSEPGSPASGALTLIGYRAAPRADATLAYRLEGTLAPDAEHLRVGLKGTAKLYGRHTVLLNYVLRRPLAALRGHLGW
ncbi:efflux RND transporter periplasmic adaptor subunit [Pseudomonas putida]